MTRQTTFFIILLLFFGKIVNAQSKIQLDCNTIFIGVDSITYQQLFTNKYVKDTLFICRTASSQTNKEAYTGKYLIGENATVEFFCAKPTGKLGDKLGDAGIELKTRSTNQLDALISRANLLKIAIDTAHVNYVDADTTIAWYHTISTANPDEKFGFSTIEYQPGYLKYIGFTDAEISAPMTFLQYNTKLSGGRPYPRLFSSIKSVSVSASNSQVKKMKDFARLNYFTINRKKLANGDFEIFCKADDNLNFLKLNSIQVTLLKPQPKHTIPISNMLTIVVDDKLATFLFK